MGETIGVQPLSQPFSTAADRGTRRLLTVSGVALVAQAAVTDYGPGRAPAAVPWFLVGCLLLWLVYRRHSRVARGLIIVTSLMGAAVCGLGALDDVRLAVLALAFVAQAAPLMSRQVRRHVQTTA